MAISPVTMEKIISLCKRRGFIFPGSALYGGLANTWDYGPLGVQLKKNIKDSWWKTFVEHRQDMIGFDAGILMNPKVWEASGHVAGFSDPLVDCRSCKSRFRADHLDGSTCPNCGKEMLTSARQFNMMFQTFVGPMEESANRIYLRPETAQGIFVNFHNVMATTRKSFPFGIGQIGKAFRNEITPGNFTFRTIEFEQMEIEYFHHPSQWESLFEQWLQDMLAWGSMIGLERERLIPVEIPDDERAHYSKRTVDIAFAYPFGQEELWGLAYRADFDLRNHQEHSGQDLSVPVPEGSGNFLPHVIEPSFGVDRTLLALLLSVYREEDAPTVSGGSEPRVVLGFPRDIAPVQVAVLPLSKKSQLQNIAHDVFHLLGPHWRVEYDETQSIGKRYRRQDEIGTPLCVTVDFTSISDRAVTVRDRDSMAQERVPIGDLAPYLKDQFMKPLV